MPDPTPQERERAEAIASAYIDPTNFADAVVSDPGDEAAQQNVRYLIDQHAATIATAFAEQRERDAQRIDYLYDRSLEEQQTFEREGLTAEAERAKMKGIAFHQARESVRHGSDGGD
jgi:hypothetical protein